MYVHFFNVTFLLNLLPDYVLELERSMAVGCGLVVNTQWTVDEDSQGEKRSSRDRSGSRLTDRSNSQIIEKSLEEEEEEGEDEESHELLVSFNYGYYLFHCINSFLFG